MMEGASRRAQVQSDFARLDIRPKLAREGLLRQPAISRPPHLRPGTLAATIPPGADVECDTLHQASANMIQQLP